MRQGDQVSIHDGDGDDALARALGNLQPVDSALPAPITDRADLPPLADETDSGEIISELAGLPPEQLLLRYRGFNVYFGGAQQMPNTLREITRLREMTFRAFDEGSGAPVDADVYDQTYLHLLIHDAATSKIVGAYRLGRTDVLRQQADPADAESTVYLAQMFDFDDSF